MAKGTSGNFLRKTTSSLASSVLSNTIFPSREARTTPPELKKQILFRKKTIGMEAILFREKKPLEWRPSTNYLKQTICNQNYSCNPYLMKIHR
jgi:hypothetical protein